MEMRFNHDHTPREIRHQQKLLIHCVNRLGIRIAQNEDKNKSQWARERRVVCPRHRAEDSAGTLKIRDAGRGDMVKTYVWGLKWPDIKH